MFFLRVRRCAATCAAAGWLACTPEPTSVAPAGHDETVLPAGEAEAEDAGAAHGAPRGRPGDDRIGTVAPPLTDAQWATAAPEPLEGRVRVIRFWTDTCPFCRASAPAFAELDRTRRDSGLSVVGVFHPKPRGTPRSPEDIAAIARAWGWSFGVAIDTDWSLLDAFWLAHGERDFTSVTFVVDRGGVVRFVHPGPELHPGGAPDHQRCRDDYDALVAVVDALLAAPR